MRLVGEENRERSLCSFTLDLGIVIVVLDLEGSLRSVANLEYDDGLDNYWSPIEIIDFAFGDLYVEALE